MPHEIKNASDFSRGELTLAVILLPCVLLFLSLLLGGHTRMAETGQAIKILEQRIRLRRRRREPAIGAQSNYLRRRKLVRCDRHRAVLPGRTSLWIPHFVFKSKNIRPYPRHLLLLQLFPAHPSIKTSHPPPSRKISAYLMTAHLTPPRKVTAYLMAALEADGTVFHEIEASAETANRRSLERRLMP